MTVLGSNFIFIHVPKCAGKSIAKYFGGTTKSLPSHAPLSHFDESVTSRRFSFGFVRNPWDRMVSMYSFALLKLAKKQLIDNTLSSNTSFKQWLMENQLFIGSDKYTNLQMALLPLQRRSQMYWLDGCNYIGKIETLEKDIEVIRQNIGYKKTWWNFDKIPHKNKSSRTSYQHYYDQESYDFAARWFSAEITRFSYSFEP